MNEEGSSPVIGVILMVAITVILAAVIAVLVFNPSPPPTYEIEQVTLKSLHDQNTMEGSFSLGSGSINSVPSFIYYADYGGYYKLETIPADKTKIIEGNGTPHLIIFKPMCTVLFGTKKEECGCTVGCIRSRTYELHVPVGTTIQQYNLDGRL